MSILPRAFLRRCRTALWRTKVTDSTGVKLTGGKLLMRTLILRRLLLRTVLGADERFVGILLPPSVAGVVTNAVMPLCGRVGVNLNYTVSADVLNYCCRQCGIRHILTSRKFIERMQFKLEPELVYLEDFKQRATALDMIAAALQAFLWPVSLLERRLGLHRIKSDDLFTVIFTSGSTGQPKGVMLSYGNIGSNMEAIDKVVRLLPSDVVGGVLPFFHSFGFTVTLWCVLGLDIAGAYHFSPLDAKIIGKLCHENNVTVMVATPTFLRTYLRRCTAEEFARLDVVVAGAEKLPRDLADAFEEKFHVRPVEGYGTTELSPLVSVNIPPSRAPQGSESKGVREGSVGRPVPGVSAKVVHRETGEALDADEPGMLLIKGPNVMQGYLNQPEKTAEVMRDGWYLTGDIAFIDADGFIYITGRESRFSKIGGEMVPHIAVEEALQRVVSSDEHKLTVAVSAVSDARKGERLVVLHTPLDKSAEQIGKELSAAGLPNLWIPGTDSFYEVDEIPVLGTGKLDLQAIKQLAVQKASSQN